MLICVLQLTGSYPTVGRFIHVSLYFSCIRHQILHPPILKRSWIRSGKDGLHTAHKQANECRENTFTIDVRIDNIQFQQGGLILANLCDMVDSQLVNKVVAQVLCDVFMPGLSHACSGRRSCCGHRSQACQTIIHQTEQKREMRRGLKYQPPKTTHSSCDVTGWTAYIYKNNHREKKPRTSGHSGCRATWRLVIGQTTGLEAAHHHLLPQCFHLEKHSSWSCVTRTNATVFLIQGGG